MFLYREGELHYVTSHNVDPRYRDLLNSVYPMRPDETQISGRVILTGDAVKVEDAQADPSYDQRFPKHLGWRRILGVPMLRSEETIGVIVVGWSASGPVREAQETLLRTFADQAVIAIENARLFEAEQARTKELQESLDYQTATSEVLGIISRSPTEAQPVFDMIARNAVALCDSLFANVFQFDGELLHLKATHDVESSNQELLRTKYPMRPDPTQVSGRVLLSRSLVQLEDVLADLEFDQRFPQAMGWRRTLGVPMIRDGKPIGVIVVGWADPGKVAPVQEALLTTFADQAVIAIENARLFEDVQTRTAELDRTVSELRALSDIGRTISSKLDVQAVLSAILTHACHLADSGGGAIYAFDRQSGMFELEAGHNMSDEMIATVRERPIHLGEALVGECAESREPVQIEDLAEAPPHPLFAMHLAGDIRALLAVPLLHQDEVVGALVVRRKHPGAFEPDTIALLQAFASQSAIAIHNARMFREIEEKGEQLRIASEHKSQFLANMSHELRTPLNAILGYAELMQDGIYGEINEKAQAILGRVQSNGKHLLGLINDVLDLSKIEAGQIALQLEEYSIADIVQTVLTATDSLAREKNLTITPALPNDLPVGRGDERRITQVLLNLVGNAIKFTDEGSVQINVVGEGQTFTVEVKDTGAGIPETEYTRIFEEFHQVDSSNTKKKGGTGLGLAISRRIVKLHGGTISVESEVGKGSIFRVELPVRVDKQRSAAE